MADGQYGPCISNHRISIKDRGGSRHVENLVDIGSVQWNRKRDAKSSAEFTITGRACDAQADIIRAVAAAAGRYEAVIHRGEDRVWEGPIRRVETVRDNALFLATDVKEYLDHTSLSRPWPNSDGGGPTLMGDRIEQIITHELTEPYTMLTNSGGVVVDRWETLDPPINVLPHMLIYPGTVLTRSSTEEFEMLLGEHLDNLVDGGMDFTVVGRRIIFWDSALSIGQTRMLTDADFLGDIRVIRYASDHWSISHLSASQADEDADRGVGHAGAPHPYYGVWENIVSMQSEEGTDEPTQTELNSQAQRDILHRTPVPLEVRVPGDVGIRLTDDLTIQHLVPGVIMPVTTAKNIQVVTQPQRLDDMSVTETAEGETVTVNLSPFGQAVA
ncbi:minor tail protein [Microbacterium phage Fireman]|uniref:Minor tail protein n=1 Tax=Microbacterium phage Fireman TaxID=2530118 RepID=A0A481VVW7_9CAUD|nr:minor tail protein [Microbacterium phage Fireman]QBI98122.1 minor tail protein [Microbacterium phage Fireman]